MHSPNQIWVKNILLGWNLVKYILLVLVLNGLDMWFKRCLLSSSSCKSVSEEDMQVFYTNTCNQDHWVLCTYNAHYTVHINAHMYKIHWKTQISCVWNSFFFYLKVLLFYCYVEIIYDVIIVYLLGCWSV